MTRLEEFLFLIFFFKFLQPLCNLLLLLPLSTQKVWSVLTSITIPRPNVTDNTKRSQGDTDRQQLNPIIALYTFGYAGGQHPPFFRLFEQSFKYF